MHIETDSGTFDELHDFQKLTTYYLILFIGVLGFLFAYIPTGGN